MPCSRYSSVKHRRSSLIDAPYCRQADWWKNPDQSDEDNASCYDSATKPSYQVAKRSKRWSVVFLSSGPRRSTDAEEQFKHYALKWKAETGGDSSLTSITNNMSYLRVIGLGEKAIPLILQDLQKEPAPWFVALRAISEDDSVGRDSPGDFHKMAAAWIRWGKDHGYIQ